MQGRCGNSPWGSWTSLRTSVDLQLSNHAHYDSVFPSIEALVESTWSWATFMCVGARKEEKGMQLVCIPTLLYLSPRCASRRDMGTVSSPAFQHFSHCSPSASTIHHVIDGSIPVRQKGDKVKLTYLLTVGCGRSKPPEAHSYSWFIAFVNFVISWSRESRWISTALELLHLKLWFLWSTLLVDLEVSAVQFSSNHVGIATLIVINVVVVNAVSTPPTSSGDF